VPATLSARDLVPEIWLPDPSIRRERELARFRLHRVRHRATLKNRARAALIASGHPCPVSDLFGHAGRELLDRLAIPDPWRRTVEVSLRLIDDLSRRSRG
jgi:transposase